MFKDGAMLCAVLSLGGPEAPVPAYGLLCVVPPEGLVSLLGLCAPGAA